MSFASLLHSFRAWKLYRDNVYELEQLSDRQLADVGLSRDSIRDVARRAAQQPKASRAELGLSGRLTTRST